MHFRAPAKLTTSLRIVGVRPDGYHEIEIDSVSLDLADDLEITEGSGLEIVGTYATGISNDETNLVSRALKLAGREAQVVLTKNIPHGAGLGGGSSDAAAILRWAGMHDLDIAGELGSDVCYCLIGGHAHVSGVGEIVDPQDFVARTYTLLLAPVFVSTPQAFAEWDKLGGPKGDNGNDLEPASISAVPELKIWRDALGDATGATPRMAGSGSTFFVEGEFDFEPPSGGTVVVTHTVPAH